MAYCMHTLESTCTRARVRARKTRRYNVSLNGTTVSYTTGVVSC